MKKPISNWITGCCSLIFLALISTNFAQAQYCTSAATASDFERITNVTFDAVNNNSGGSPYSDYTDQIGTVSPGIAFSLSVSHTQDFVSPFDFEHIQVWVDWNQDDVFSPDERTQFDEVCTDACTRTQMIPVPAGALLGSTRMRIILSWNIAAAGPCITGFDGEVEDYGVNVVAGACAPPAFTFSVTNDCEADTYDVDGILDSYGTNTSITVVRTRSDAVPLPPLTIIGVPAGVGNSIQFFNDIPFGVTVTAELLAANPICNTTFNFSQALCPVTNDECADALPLPCNGSYLGTTEGATPDTVACAPFGNAGAGVWFTYTATAQTNITLATCDPLTTFDTDLTVFTGSCGELTCYTGFSDDGYTDGTPGGCASETFAAGGTFTAMQGETYYILLSSYFAADFGQYKLTVTCDELACTSPDLDLSTVDINGDPISGCLEAGAPYYVNVAISNGSGNANYDVSVNGSPSVTIAAGGSGIVGPISTGTAANVVATGADIADCNATASIASPEVCIATNDFPCDAIAIPTDGTLVTGSNLGATADTLEVVPPQGACNGNMSWCDGPEVNNSIWYTFVGTASGRVRIDGCNPGSTFDSQFAIYTAEDCDDYSTFELIGANDDRSAPLFTACEFGSFRSGIELCVEEGVTYYLQVDGYNGASGLAGITIDEVDGDACNCTPPVVPAVFTFASTAAYCAPDTVGYTVTFYSPEDLGSNEFFVYTYNIDGGNSGVENVAAGDSITLDEIIPLGTLINITITLSDTACAGIVPGFPLSGSIAQSTAACDPDCNGVPGGPDVPGAACDDGNPLTEGDVYNAECECAGNLVVTNDEPCDATALACGVPVIQTTQGATQSLDPITCEGFTAAQAFDVWFSFTADGTSSYTLTENAPSDLVLEVFSANDCNDFTSMACADIPETIALGVLDAGDYLVRAYAYFASIPAYEINIQLDCENLNAAVFNGSVNWNSNCADRDAEITFYLPNTATVAATYTATVNAAGDFTIDDVLAGTYDIIVDVPGYLNKGIADVVTVAGNNDVDFGAIIAGDVNDNNVINILDVSGANPAFNTAVGNPAFILFADVNCSGTVNILDFSALNPVLGTGGANAPLP